MYLRDKYKYVLNVHRFAYVGTVRCLNVFPCFRFLSLSLTLHNTCTNRNRHRITDPLPANHCIHEFYVRFVHLSSSSVAIQHWHISTSISGIFYGTPTKENALHTHITHTHLNGIREASTANGRIMLSEYTSVFHQHKKKKCWRNEWKKILNKDDTHRKWAARLNDGGYIE